MKSKKSYDLIHTLVEKAKGGNQEAFGELLDLYKPLFSSMMARLRGVTDSAEDAEDVRQELTVVFYNAIMSYDPEQTEVKFGLYAKICLNNALITQIRNLQKGGLGCTVPLPENEEALGVEEEDISSTVIRREEWQELTDKIKTLLSDYENKVWTLYVSGTGCQKIAATLGKDEKSIENAIFRIRQKLKKNIR